MKFEQKILDLLTEMPHTASDPDDPFVALVDFKLETFGDEVTYENLVERVSETLNSILEEVRDHVLTRAILAKSDQTGEEFLEDLKERLT